LSQNDLDGALFAGELALDGSLRPIRSAIITAEIAKKHEIHTVYVPSQKANQAHDQIQSIVSIPLHQRNKIPPYIF